MKKEPIIKVLKVEPDKHPELIEMPNTLEAMQAIVGGLIEISPVEEGVAIVCNEEGKMTGLPLNRPLYHEGEMYDIIAGTFFIAGDDWESGEFVSLTPEQIVKYSKQFLYPATYIKMHGKIIAVPIR